LSNRPLGKENWRTHWYDIIFKADTPAGKNFDVILLVAILGSLLSIMLETVDSISEAFEVGFQYLEVFFTVIFTAEYIMRLLIVEKKRKYILSFYGIIDLLSILPTYLSFVFDEAQYFMVIRSFRLIRVFRVLKMVRFLGEASVLTNALRASRIKITVFLIVVMCVVFIMGTLMYVIEGPEHGFESIPISIYWAIVTLTTVGYGDISPETPLGQVMASIIMIIGYAILAVPTGIVTSEITKAQVESSQIRCGNCGTKGHNPEAAYCNYCGEEL
jgi:voltage-gated potassium channel